MNVYNFIWWRTMCFPLRLFISSNECFHIKKKGKYKGIENDKHIQNAWCGNTLWKLKYRFIPLDIFAIFFLHQTNSSFIACATWNLHYVYKWFCFISNLIEFSDPRPCKKDCTVCTKRIFDQQKYTNVVFYDSYKG